MTNNQAKNESSKIDDDALREAVTEIHTYVSKIKNDTYVENDSSYNSKFDGDVWTEAFIKLQNYMVERQRAMYEKDVENHTSKLGSDSVRALLLADNKYVAQNIDCGALYQLLIKNHVNHRKAVWMTIRMVSTVLLRPRKASPESRKNLKAALTQIGAAIESLKIFSAYNGILFTKYFFHNGSNAIDDLSWIQMEIMDTLNSHYPDGKPNKVHYETIRELANLWRKNIENPKIYDGCPFVEAVSICTGSNLETLLDIVKRMRRGKII